MPATRPEAISNRIRLTYEARAAERPFVPEDGTVNSFLAAVIDKVPPDEHGVSWGGSEDNLLSRPDKELSQSSVGVMPAGVMSLVHLKTVQISIHCQPPVGHQNFIKSK